MPWLIHEVQQDQYNGNVWGPYDTSAEAHKDIPILKDITDKYDTKFTGPFSYKVMFVRKVRQ